MTVTREQLSELKREMPYKIRKGPKGVDLAYIDARQAMDLLDDVCGPENWQCEYKQVKDVVYCGIAILTDSGWVWKWDAGDESNIEAEKGEASDAFKRAAVRWGVGRFLYSIDSRKPTQSKALPAPQKPYSTPKKQEPAQFPMTEAQSKQIQSLCHQINMDGEMLNGTLKGKFGHGWKHLTQAEAVIMIRELTEFRDADSVA